MQASDSKQQTSIKQQSATMKQKAASITFIK
jgi:hypothetical protein